MKTVYSRQQQEENRRLHALAEFQLIDTPPEDGFDRLTTLAARLFEVQIVLITLVGRDKQFFKSRHGIAICETARDVSFCSHAIKQDDILFIPDALKDPRFATNPLVLGYPFIRFYAGKPLVTATGDRLGTVCLIDSVPRDTLSPIEEQNLNDLTALVMDRMELHRLQSLRSVSQQRFESIASTSPDAIICSDLIEGITFWNAAARKMFGYEPSEMLGQTAAKIISMNDIPVYKEELSKLRRGQGSTLEGKVFPLRGLRKAGTEFPAEVSLSAWRDGKRTSIGIIVRDVTERHESEARLFRLASLDMLTGLANRSAWYRQLVLQKSSNVPFTILLLDLDGFKAVNDAYGHAAGDMVLCRVAYLLEDLCEDAVINARLGGDEFAILLAGIEEHNIDTLASGLINRLLKPFYYEETLIEIRASMGIAHYPMHGKDEGEVMKAADLALYRAKANGKGRYEIFLPEFREVDRAKRTFENELNQALIKKEFILVYQPKFFSDSLQLAGCEVLLRWAHPTRGVLKPSSFIETLSVSPFSADVGEWIIKEAFTQMIQWRREYPFLTCSINLFTSQLHHDGLGSCVRETIGISATPFINFEVDEAVLINTDMVVQERLHTLNRLGVQITVDHFGKYTAALSLLCQEFVSSLKIDKRLTQDIDVNMQVTKLVSAIVASGRQLGLVTSAGGVETKNQLDHLLLAGCQIVQGNYLSKALDAEQFSELLQQYAKK
ncbi:putative bifunctional diguanylate cyclase/phosphodiesterase [Ewingella sp. S1.OA.A_B6]